jgi:hypothetical protein
VRFLSLSSCFVTRVLTVCSLTNLSCNFPRRFSPLLPPLTAVLEDSAASTVAAAAEVSADSTVEDTAVEDLAAPEEDSVEEDREDLAVEEAEGGRPPSPVDGQ